MLKEWEHSQGNAEESTNSSKSIHSGFVPLSLKTLFLISELNAAWQDTFAILIYNKVYKTYLALTNWVLVNGKIPCCKDWPLLAGTVAMH